MKRLVILAGMLSMFLLVGVAAYGAENTTWGKVKHLLNEEVASQEGALAPAAKGAATKTAVDVYAFANGEGFPPDNPCGGNDLISPPEIKGNTLHLLRENYVLTSSLDDRLNGQGRVDVDVWVNLVSGAIRYHGTVKIDNIANYNGTWEGAFKGQLLKGQPIDFNGMETVVGAEIILRGTGDFEGLTFKFNHLPFTSPAVVPPVEDPDGVGGCEFGGEVWSGRILDPNAN